MDNKNIVEEFNKGLEEYFNTGNMDKMAAVIDPGVVISVAGMPPNLEGLKQALPAFRAALSNFKMEVSDMVAEGDIVYCRISWTAIHSGELFGVPATNKKLSVTEVHFDRVKDGKIVEHGGNWDQFGLLQQVGAIPQS